jgi:hypothetical protein
MATPEYSSGDGGKSNRLLGNDRDCSFQPPKPISSLGPQSEESVSQSLWLIRLVCFLYVQCDPDTEWNARNRVNEAAARASIGFAAGTAAAPQFSCARASMTS